MSLILTNSYLVSPFSLSTSSNTVSALAFFTTASPYDTPAGSDDGQYRIYTNRSGVNVSNNYGATYTNYIVGGDITGVACNSSGSVMYAVLYSYGLIYVSTNYGATWNVSSSTPSVDRVDEFSIATNATGELAVCGGFNLDACVVTSNTGNSWSNTAVTGLGVGATRKVAMDSSGNVIITGSGYKSNNAGASWTRVINTNINSNIAISGDATKILVSDPTYSSYILLSTNGGTTFVDITSLGTTTWGRVAISRDGTIMMARNSAGTAYVSYNSGSTWATY